MEFPFLHPSSTAVFSASGLDLGYVGDIHPEVLTAIGLGLEQAPLYCELDLERVFAASQRRKLAISELTHFPPVTRDLALILNRSVSHDEIVAAITKSPKKKFLVGAEMFDLYQDDQLGPEKKSLAFALAFRSPERTLTDQDVDNEIKDLLAHLETKVGAHLR